MGNYCPECGTKVFSSWKKCPKCDAVLLFNSSNDLNANQIDKKIHEIKKTYYGKKAIKTSFFGTIFFGGLLLGNIMSWIIVLFSEPLFIITTIILVILGFKNTNENKTYLYLGLILGILDLGFYSFLISKIFLI